MANVRALLAGSPIVASHRGPEDTRVQDAYSLRCAPTVAGGARDTVEHAATVAAASWPPRSTTPYHARRPCRVQRQLPRRAGAYALDFLAIVVADVASMSERRTDRFLDVARTMGCPPFWPTTPASTPVT